MHSWVLSRLYGRWSINICWINDNKWFTEWTREVKTSTILTTWKESWSIILILRVDLFLTYEAFKSLSLLSLSYSITEFFKLARISCYCKRDSKFLLKILPLPFRQFLINETSVLITEEDRKDRKHCKENQIPLSVAKVSRCTGRHMTLAPGKRRPQTQ